jgi:hypothetical protein
MNSVFRPEPKAPAEAYKTYEVARPKSTHSRPATCQEVDCQSFLNGWRSTFDLRTDLGKRQSYYVRMRSGRSFVRVLDPRPGILVLEFAPGQRCFAEHRIALERPPIFLVRGGDWRGNPLGTPTVTRTPAAWLDDFGSHQQKIAEAIERG